MKTDAVLSAEEIEAWCAQFQSTPWNMLPLETSMAGAHRPLLVLKSAVVRMREAQEQVRELREELAAHRADRFVWGPGELQTESTMTLPERHDGEPLP